MATIDINCDMGEGVGNESLLMPYISSANIACGYHAGDAAEMRKMVRLCLLHGVAIGAHPSYPDKANFGRTNMKLSSADMVGIITDQLTLLRKIVVEEGGTLHHVKPHGALYNAAAEDEGLSMLIASAIHSFDSSLIVYGLAGSKMISGISSAGLKVASEVFADRTYQPGGLLTPRNLSNALINNVDVCLAQVMQLVQEKSVTTTNGSVFPLQADTICIHGDGVHAVTFASAIHSGLVQAGITIQSIKN